MEPFKVTTNFREKLSPWSTTDSGCFLFTLLFKKSPKLVGHLHVFSLFTPFKLLTKYWSATTSHVYNHETYNLGGIDIDLYIISAKWPNAGQVIGCFDFMMRESSITIPDFGEATCVEAVANLLVISDFVSLYNCKLVNKVDGAILKISDSNNFITAEVLCWWAGWTQDIIFGVKIGSLRSALLPSIICLGSQRLFFKIVSVIGNSALTSHLFQKSLSYFLPKLEIFLTDFTIVLLLTAVKSTVSNGLTTKFSKSLFTSKLGVSPLKFFCECSWADSFFKTAERVDLFTSTKFSTNES